MVKKILVIRFSSIGDIVLTSPVVRCLKAQTDAEIHFVTKTQYKGILEHHPHLDKLYHFEEEITEVLPQMKAEGYDFVVDLHNNIRSIRLKKALKTRSKAFPKLNPKKWLLTNFKIDWMPDVHVVDRYFEAVQPLAVENDNKGLDYFIAPENEVELSHFNIPEKFIAFSIGAKFATKRLPAQKMIGIIQRINLPVVLLGGSEDETAALKIRKAKPEVINLVGKLNLDQSASVLKQATKVITHDTGLMHISAAFNKEIISVWGNTVPQLGMYPYMPEHPERSEIKQVDISCRPCSKIGFDKCPKKHFKCMQHQNESEIAASVNN